MSKTFIHAYAEFPSLGDAGKIWIWLDGESNEGLKAFPYGGRAFFLLAAYPSDMEIDLSISDGQWDRVNTGSNRITETVVFDRANQASVSYPVAAINETVWVGESLGLVTATGGCGLKTERAGVAELRITYTYNFTRYSVLLRDKSPQNQSLTWPVLVSAQGGRDGDENRPQNTLEIVFYGGETELADYYLYVVDDCTDAPLKNVAVIFDQDDIGTTDHQGRIHVGRLLTGSVHTVRIEHPGYRLFTASTEIPAQEEDTDALC